MRWSFTLVPIIGIIGLAACGNNASPSDDAVTTVPPPVTAPPRNTVDQFASAVALSAPKIAPDPTCAPVVDCAAERASHVGELYEDIDALGDPPDEIADLVDRTKGQLPAMIPLVQELSDCLDEAGASCMAEALALDRHVDGVSDDLAAWEPYL